VIGDVNGDGVPTVAVALADYNGPCGYHGSVSSSPAPTVRSCASARESVGPSRHVRHNLGDRGALGDLTGRRFPTSPAGVPAAYRRRVRAAGTTRGLLRRATFRGAPAPDPLGVGRGELFNPRWRPRGTMSGDGVADSLGAQLRRPAAAACFSKDDRRRLGDLGINKYDPGTTLSGSQSRVGGRAGSRSVVRGVPDTRGRQTDDRRSQGRHRPHLLGADGTLLRKCSDPLARRLHASGADCGLSSISTATIGGHR